MLRHATLAIVLSIVALPVAAASRDAPAAAPPPRPEAGSISASLGERGGWGLFIGVAIVGLAVRRRRVGPVVTH